MQLGLSRVCQHQVAEHERSGNGVEVWGRRDPAEVQPGWWRKKRPQVELLLEEQRAGVVAEELQVWAAWAEGVVIEQKMRAVEAAAGTESGVLK